MSARTARTGGGRTNRGGADLGARTGSAPVLTTARSRGELTHRPNATGRRTGRADMNQYNRHFEENFGKNQESLHGAHRATATTMNVRDIMLNSARKIYDPGFDVEDIDGDGKVSEREKQAVVNMMDMDGDGYLDPEEKELLEQITRAKDADKMGKAPVVHLVDLDGDGQIDEAEEALMRSLADVDGDGIVDSTDVYLAKIQYRANQIGRDDVVDMSGDGKISDLELRHEREAAGRKYVIEDFVQRNRNIIHEFNPLYKRMSHWEQRDDLMHEFKDSVSFADVFKALTEKEHVMKRCTSNQVRHCLARDALDRLEEQAGAAGPTASGRLRRHADGPWARKMMPEEAALGHHGYNTARALHEARLERCFTPRLLQHERPNALGTRFCKNKGNIPGYGNFSSYGAAMVKATGKTFSNTR